MEPVQYKGYTIQVKHYKAFKHDHREYPEVFDYVILTEGVKADVGYGFNNLEETIRGAKMCIDQRLAPSR